MHKKLTSHKTILKISTNGFYTKKLNKYHSKSLGGVIKYTEINYNAMVSSRQYLS
jgi:hypothetical protein